MATGNGRTDAEGHKGYVPPSFELTDDLDGEAKLRETVERELPQFCEAVKADANMLMLHQDGFAAGYDIKEYVLLGMAIKYAGLYGKDIHMGGTNGETL